MRLTIAVHSPQKQEAQDSMARLKEKGYEIVVVMASSKSLERAWDMYKDISFATETDAGVIDVSEGEINEILKTLTSLEDVQNKIIDAIKTHLEKADNVRFTMLQSIFLNNTLILEAWITNVFIDMNHQKVVEPDNSLISGWPDLGTCLKRDGVRNE